MPAKAGTQATTVSQTTAVTSATSNSKDDCMTSATGRTQATAGMKAATGTPTQLRR
jgi:hypothetical protein